MVASFCQTQNGVFMFIRTTIAGFNVTFGENEISVEMPKNILTQLIGIGKVRINQDDINKFIEMIK